jgi:ribosome-binding ATPase YchF (GTP1/OBG family)
MKIGIVGYQGSGKSTLFHWLTGVKADPALAHASQSAMAPIPDERIAPLCDIYHPKKITPTRRVWRARTKETLPAWP